MARSHTLGKAERLKSRKAIEELFRSGKKFTIGFLGVSYALVNDVKNEPLQFGVGVSSKNFKKAVDRNRVKRLVRESYRLQKLPLKARLLESKQSLHVFFIYNGKEIPGYNDVYTAVGSGIQRLLAMLNEKK